MYWIYFIKNNINRLKNGIVRWLQSKSIIGFQGLSIYDVITFVNHEIRNDRFTSRAATIAFYQVLAIIPFLIFILNLLPYFPIEGLQFEIISQIETNLPPRIGEWLTTQIEDVLSNRKNDVLSISFISAIWLSSNAMMAIFTAFKKRGKHLKKVPWYTQRLKAITIDIVVVVMLLMTGILLVASDFILNTYLSVLFEWKVIQLGFVKIVNPIIAFSIIYLTLYLLYRFGTNVKRSLPFLNPGSLLGTGLIVFGSIGFGWALQTFNLYNSIYGSLGTIAALMGWLYMTALFLLIGFELNYSIYSLKNKKMSIL